MSSARFAITLLALVLTAAIARAAPAPAPMQYTVIVLGPTSAISADGLSDEGVVIGSALLGAANQAAILYPMFTLLGVLNPGTDSYAHAIQGDKSVGYGYGGMRNQLNHAWQHMTGAPGLTDMNQGMVLSVAQAVNQAGTPVGFCVESQGGKPCVFGPTNTILSTLGGTLGSIDAINNAGIAVGSSQTPTGQTHATMWVMGLPTDLHPSGATWSGANGINASNTVTINASTGPYLWSAATGHQPLTALPGFNTVAGINDAGTAIGEVETGEFTTIAVRWTPEAGIEPLSGLLMGSSMSITSAIAINNQGQILAYGNDAGQPRQALLLNPFTVAPQGPGLIGRSTIPPGQQDPKPSAAKKAQTALAKAINGDAKTSKR